jgi:hypothetical protein
MKELVADANGWYPITLPSMGLFYGDKLPGGDVMITPWTTVHEEMMIQTDESRAETLLRVMTESNVKLPAEMPYEDLLITDQYFILVQLRLISLCSSYSYGYLCPSCKKEAIGTTDMRNLEVQVPDDDWPVEPIIAALPKSGIEVGLRFQRVSDQKFIGDYERKSRGSGSVYRWARQIQTIDGQNVDFQTKQDFVSKLPLLDIRVMEKAIDKWSTGYTMICESVCSDCGETGVGGLPQSPTFFRPTDDDIQREIERSQDA